MNTIDTQAIAANCAEIILDTGRHKEVMAVRAYGACLKANERASRTTVDRFHLTLMTLLSEPYGETFAALSSYERITTYQEIARRVYQSIQDVVHGCAE